jgi:hypothetical protein
MTGVGVMVSHLFGSPADYEQYYGKTIQAIALKDDVLNIDFEDGVKIHIFDNGQSCCETRYMVCDDNLESLVGQKLTKIEIKSGPDINDGECHEQQFLEISTDGGFVTFANHNEHNGYYGGFALTIGERK